MKKQRRKNEKNMKHKEKNKTTERKKRNEQKQKTIISEKCVHACWCQMLSKFSGAHYATISTRQRTCITQNRTGQLAIGRDATATTSPAHCMYTAVHTKLKTHTTTTTKSVAKRCKHAEMNVHGCKNKKPITKND